MPLKALVKEDEFKKMPEVLQAEYDDQGDGTYVLNIEDRDYKSKLDEFRTSNRNLMKERDKYTGEMAKYKDIDPEKYREAMEARQKLDEIETKELAKAGNLDEVIAKRTEAMRKEYDNRLKALEVARNEDAAKATKYREALRTQKVQGTIRDAVSKVGNLRPGAMQDVLLRAERTWQLDDSDELIAPEKFDSKGEPLTPDAWAKSLLTDSPYLFEASQGGGASGGSKGARQQGGTKTLRNPDAKTFGSNLEDIASGKVNVELESGNP